MCSENGNILSTVSLETFGVGLHANGYSKAHVVHANTECGDGIHQNDSVSNTGSKGSYISTSIGRSSTSSARIKAEAESAALVARAAV